MFARWWKTGPRLVLVVAGLLLPVAAAAGPSPIECREWFDNATAALNEHNIHDAGSQRIDWYPHLRVTRWLAAIRPDTGETDARRFWLRRLADEARAGWHAELTRLPDEAALLPHNRGKRIERMESCVDVLLETTQAARLPELEIPDSYSTWQRRLGIYPLTRLLAVPSIEDYRREMRERFDRETDIDRVHYLPPEFRGTTPIPGALAHNPLDMPWPTEGSLRALLAHYAPVLSVARDDLFNRPGTAGLAYGTPEVATLGATVYTWPSWQFFRERPLLQLNYQFWFSRRPKSGVMDPYAGKLDGLIWRVTLRHDGRVLAYDSIHPCGCYHKVYRVEPSLHAVKPDQAGQPVFYPYLAPDALRQRVQVVLQPDTHYVIAVRPFSSNREGEKRAYRLADADILRRLPSGRGHGSFFDRSGLVAGTERSERYYFWPLGVPSAGAMRQPGHHAIAFIGKRHFDDPHMLSEVLEPDRPFQ